MERNHTYIDTSKLINEQSTKYVCELSSRPKPDQCLGQ